MSVCVETSSTALIQPAVSLLSTNSSFSNVVASTSISQSSAGPVTNTTELKSEQQQQQQHLPGKSIAKLVVTSQHGPSTGTQVLQKVVNSPLITVLNSTGPLTVVKSLCVTSVVPSAPHYTLVNSASPLNVTNTVGKPPTITVLNCGPLTSPVTVVKAISTQHTIEKSPSDVLPIQPSSAQTTAVSPAALIENRGHNVFVKNTCPDSTMPDNVPQSHKLLTATNFSSSNVLTNIPATATANGQRSKLKILSNVQIAGSSQQNVMVNKALNPPQPKYNVAGRQKFIELKNAPKYLSKPPNVLKPSTVNPGLKSPTEKPGKLLHPPMQKGPIKSLPPSNFLAKPQQGIKTISPRLKPLAGPIQGSSAGLRTIPPQRPQKVATKANYIGKHAVQAQKIKQGAHPKLKTVRTPSNMYNYHAPPIHEKQMTFNQALTAQIIETLSNTTTPPPSNRYEILPARYDSAFNCPDSKPEPAKADDKAKSGLDALSLICQAVLLDHNYNATLPSESPPRPTPPINTQAQVNGIPPTNIYSSIQNKRRIVLPPSSLTTSSHSNVSLCASNSASMLGSHGSRDDDAASDISDGSDRKHDTEGEETDTAPEAEDVKNDDHYGDYVTRCICGFLHDDGYMVECDKCKVWQHVQCVVKNRQIPEEYLCELCDPSKHVDRQKARTIQQQWIRERQLIEPKIRKEAKVKDTLIHKEHHMSDSESSDGERIVRNNNIVAKNRTTSVARRKSDAVKLNKKEGKDTVQRKTKRKEKKIVKRRAKIPVKQPPQPSHSDDENQDTWSAHLPQLRQWIEKYEEAVTNHYSPELRARIQSIRVNGAHVDSSVNYDSTVSKCRIHTQPLTEIKYLVSTVQLAPNSPIIELRGKYMLSTQHRNSGGSLTTRQHTQRPGPFLFFYRLHKDNTEVCVDTRTYGNSARFIRRSCKPNAELRHCIEKGVLHLYIVSIAAVEKNCELTIKHESHDLAAIGTTQIACACGRPDECTVNRTTIKKNGEVTEVSRKRRGRRTISAGVPSPDIKSPVKEQPPIPISEPVPDSPKPVAEPQQIPPITEIKEEKIEEEKVEIPEPVEIKLEIKEEPLEPTKSPQPDSKDTKIKIEEPEPIKEERQKSPSPSPAPPPPPPVVKVEVKAEKPIKEEKIKSPPPTPIATRRSSHHKTSEKEDGSKETETKEQSNKSKKLSREERKLEAILRAIEQMEKADQKKQEHQAKQAHRRESEPGPNSKEEKPEEKTEPKVKRRRRRGRARTTSTNAQTRRTRLNSTDSYMTSGDENLLSPNDSLPPTRPTTSSKNDESSDSSKAAGLLLALSNGDSEGKDVKKSLTHDQDSSSNSAQSSPETPQLSSACLLVQAAVETVESGFKFPKTKKGLMNEWLNKTPEPVHSGSAVSPTSPSSHLQDEAANQSSKNLAALAQVASLCDTPTQQRGGNAKKRWLRQAISEDHSGDSPVGRPDSPPLSDAVAPPKKRKLPRESLSNDNSPPTTPTSGGPAKSIDTPRTSQEGSVEIVSSGAEGDSPPHTMESDTELKERAATMKQEFGDTVALSAKLAAKNLSGLLASENALFSDTSEHLVGTVEKTLSIFGFENVEKSEVVTTPTKRKVKLSITEYRQRKRQNTDRTDDQEMENDSQTNEDNNSSESFKASELHLPKSRSRSLSSSSSVSSLEESPTPTDIIMKSSGFNCEPTELERQRENSSLRLKKAFGFALDDDSRKPSVIDMTSILKCDLESKIKPASPLANASSAFVSVCELSMSPTLRAPGTPDRTYTPVIPPANAQSERSCSPVGIKSLVDTQVETKVTPVDEKKPASVEEEPMEVDPVEAKEEVQDVEMKSVEPEKEVGSEEKDNVLFYTPDEDEDRTTRTTSEEPENVNYVPPFNNPVYPNTNFAGFTSAIDDDSRYQSRNPSPPPDLEASQFSASS